MQEIAKERPAGVVLDINMPGMDGITVLKRIRALHGDLPVIMFSTASDANEVTECWSLGILEYAVKPADYDAFCLIVKRILAQFQAPRSYPAPSFTARLRPSTLGHGKLSPPEGPPVRQRPKE